MDILSIILFSVFGTIIMITLIGLITIRIKLENASIERQKAEQLIQV